MARQRFFTVLLHFNLYVNCRAVHCKTRFTAWVGFMEHWRVPHIFIKSDFSLRAWNVTSKSFDPLHRLTFFVKLSSQYFGSQTNQHCRIQSFGANVKIGQNGGDCATCEGMKLSPLFQSEAFIHKPFIHSHVNEPATSRLVAIFPGSIPSNGAALTFSIIIHHVTAPLWLRYFSAVILYRLSIQIN